jgi:hypothetical protein
MNVHRQLLTQLRQQIGERSVSGIFGGDFDFVMASTPCFDVMVVGG